MAAFVLTNPTVWVNDTDLTANLKKIKVAVSAHELDVTTFGSTYRTRIGGLKDVAVEGEGFWQSTPDSTIFAGLGTMDFPWTISGTGNAADVAYLAQMGRFSYQAFGMIGEAAPFVLSSKGSNKVGVVRGQLAALNQVVSATGQLGSILSLGAVGATQFLYCNFHVFAAGTTITIQVQSAPTIGFAAPTTRATIGPLTTTGGTFMARVPGAITDGFWRLNVSAITGSFTVAGAIGIQ